MLIRNDFAHKVVYTSRPTIRPVAYRDVQIKCSNPKSAVSMATVSLKGRWITKAENATRPLLSSRNDSGWFE